MKTKKVKEEKPIIELKEKQVESILDETAKNTFEFIKGCKKEDKDFSTREWDKLLLLYKNKFQTYKNDVRDYSNVLSQLRKIYPHLKQYG